MLFHNAATTMICRRSLTTALIKNNVKEQRSLSYMSSLLTYDNNRQGLEQQQRTQQLQVQVQVRHFHNSHRVEKSSPTVPTQDADAVIVAAVAPPITGTTTKSKADSTLLDRFIVTAEVTVSKIFPAGFCWQLSSILANNHLGYASDSMNFALTTGVGDALGVFGGHCMYYFGKKALVNPNIHMKHEIHTGILLGTAAFCSGTAWQPIVNILQGANLSFAQVFIGTWIGCGTAFYIGMRTARTLLSGTFQYIHEPTYYNSHTDISLSIAIGSATGFFVGTDAAYLPNENFLIDVVGIKSGTPDFIGCAIAGSSTSLGFMTTQSIFNIAYPRGKLWND